MNIEDTLYGIACMAFLLLLLSTTTVNWEGIKEADGLAFKGFSSRWDVFRFLWKSQLGVKYGTKKRATISDGEDFYIWEDEDDEDDFKEIRIRVICLLVPLLVVLLVIFL